MDSDIFPMEWKISNGLVCKKGNQAFIQPVLLMSVFEQRLSFRVL